LTLFDPPVAGDPATGPAARPETGPAARPESGPGSRAESGPGDLAYQETVAETEIVAEPGLPALPEVTVRLRLDIAYDGTGFRGFAAQQGQRTVAGVLADAIATVVRHQVTLTCAGRTDAGVHAQGQVVHVDVADGVDLARLVRSVNAMVGPQVVVRRAVEAPPGFDARRRATGRRYRYLVHETDVADPLLANLVWTVPGPLDLRAMAAAADTLLGEHDFRSLCRRPPDLGPEDPIVRRVTEARWQVATSDAAYGIADRIGQAGSAAGAIQSGVGAASFEPAAALVQWGRLLRFDVAATSFCHQMVRSMVGVLVAVGMGRWTPADVHWLVMRADRSGAPDPAPPQGLSLIHVDYGS